MRINIQTIQVKVKKNTTYSTISIEEAPEPPKWEGLLTRDTDFLDPC